MIASIRQMECIKGEDLAFAINFYQDEINQLVEQYTKPGTSLKNHRPSEYAYELHRSLIRDQ